MKNIVNDNILDNSNNILDLNAIENIVFNNANIIINNNSNNNNNNVNINYNEEKILNIDEIDLPLERNIPFVVRQNAFEINK